MICLLVVVYCLGIRDIQREALAIDPPDDSKEIWKLLFREAVQFEEAVENIVVRGLRKRGLPEKDIKEPTGGMHVIR